MRKGKEEVDDEDEEGEGEEVGMEVEEGRGSRLPPPSGSVVLSSAARDRIPSVHNPPIAPARKSKLEWEAVSAQAVDRQDYDTLEVKTIIGCTGRHGKRNGSAEEAEFFRCYGMVENAEKSKLFVCDNGNGLLRVIEDKMVRTFAGAGKSSGVTALVTPTTEGATPDPLQVRFNGPSGLCIDANDVMYLVECYGHRVRAVHPDGTVRVIAGPLTDDKGFRNGRGNTARFNGPRGVCLGPNGEFLFVADCDNHCIRKVEIATGRVTTFAGKGRTAGYKDGTATTARFSWPAQVIHAIDPHSNESVLYVSDNHNRCVRRVILATGRVSTVAGSTLQQVRDGVARQASFESPWGMMVDAQGDLYVMEHNVNCIRKILFSESHEAPPVITISGSPLNKLVTLDGKGKTVSYKHPICFLDDGRGNMYISEYAGHCIRIMRGVLPLAGVEPPPPSRLLEDLGSLELDVDTHDVAFRVSVPTETVISAHRAVLTSRSPFFRAMFTNGFAEARQLDSARAASASSGQGFSLPPLLVLDFPEATASAMYSVLHYVYTDVLDVHVDDVLDTMKLGSYLLLDRVVALCRVFLAENLSPETAIPWLIWHSEYATSENVEDGNARFIFPKQRATTFEFVERELIKRENAAEGTFSKLENYPSLLAELLSSAFVEELAQAETNPRLVIESFGTTTGALASLISFLSTGDLPLNVDTACEVLGLAHRFSISTAIAAAETYMTSTLTLATAIERFTWASKQILPPKSKRSTKIVYKFPKLRSTCLAFVAENFTDISVKYFQQVQNFVRENSDLMVEVIGLQRKAATPKKKKKK